MFEKNYKTKGNFFFVSNKDKKNLRKFVCQLVLEVPPHLAPDVYFQLLVWVPHGQIPFRDDLQLADPGCDLNFNKREREKKK